MIHKIYKRINKETTKCYRYIWFTFFAKGRFSSSNSLIISSETRGGSTWLTELLVAHLPVAVVWEPLHPTKGILKKPDYNYGDRPFVDKHIVDLKLHSALGDVFSGKKFNPWTTERNTRSTSKKAKYLLIKYVRANRLLPWMLNNFKFNYKPILLIRHPIAVAMSQLKSFYHLKDKTPGFIAPDVNNNETYKEHEQYLNSLESVLELHVALWCINYVNILTDSIIENQTIRVYYEHMLLAPENELTRIFSEWGLNLPIKKDILRKNSSTTGKESISSDIQTQLKKWSTELDKKTLDKIQSIFDYFELKIYNSKEAVPLVK